MRILFFLGTLELGGAERQALLLAEHLKAEGHDIQIWGIGEPGKIASLCDEKKICWRSKCHFLAGNFIQKSKGVIKLAHDIKEFSPDIIVPFCTTASLQCALSWRFTKTHACIWSERDIGIFHCLHEAYPFAIKLSTCVVTNSKEGNNYIQKEYSNDLDVRVINNGVYTLPPKETKEAWRKHLGASESTFIACMVANLHPRKNHSLLIEAWNEALKSNVIPDNSMLVLAGREDDTAKDVKQQINNYGIQDRVVFLGQVDDILGLLSAVDLGVLSSFTEGQPNAILEYMYSGLPVIASNLPSIKEILHDTDSILFDNDSVEELVTALKQMSSSDKRCKAGLINAERCKQMYLPARMFCEYEKLFIELLNEKRKKISLIIWCDIILWFTKLVITFLKTGTINILRKMFPKQIPVIKRYLEYLTTNSPFAYKVVKTIPADPKIGFAVLSHERPEYLGICLDSLFASDIENLDITFLIHDDGSVNPEVREIIEKQRESKYKIIRFYKPKGHNSWGAAFNSAMRELRKIDDFDILGSCDSDALFHPQWLQKTLPLFIWAKKHHKNNILGPFSPFNSSDYDFHKIMGVYNSPYGKYVVKERMGAVGYLFFRADFELFGVFAESKDDETIKTAEFIKKRIRNFSSYESYIEHIGQDSVLNKWRPSKAVRAVYGCNLVSSGWPESLKNIGTLGYFLSVESRSGMYPEKNSARCLDIIIPVVEKDAAILPLTVYGLRRNLAHPIGNIFVVTPKTAVFHQVAESLGVRLIDEKDILPMQKNEINYTSGGLDRSGWMIQQFIKLLGDTITSNPYFFVIDADTVLVRKQVFEENGKTILLVAHEFHVPYYRIFSKLLGYETSCLISFVSHMMCFEAKKIKELRSSIEKHTNKIWWKAILGMLEPDELSGFSEYELYGHWTLNNYPDTIKREYFMNTGLNRSKICSNDKLERIYGNSLRSVSFQSYLE